MRKTVIVRLSTEASTFDKLCCELCISYNNVRDNNSRLQGVETDNNTIQSVVIYVCFSWYGTEVFINNAT